jgi:hypothetical protein
VEFFTIPRVEETKEIARVSACVLVAVSARVRKADLRSWAGPGMRAHCAPPLLLGSAFFPLRRTGLESVNSPVERHGVVASGAFGVQLGI